MQLNFFRYFEKVARLRMVLLSFFLLCGVLFCVEFLIERHAYFEVEAYFNFYSIYGFVMFSIIIFGSRVLRFFLMKKENYYEEKAVDSEEYHEGGVN